MEIKIADLNRIKKDKVYRINIDRIDVNNPYLYYIKDIHATLYFYLEYETLYCNYEIEAIMVCPDARTLKEVEVRQTINEDEKVVFNELDEGLYLYDNLDINDLLKNLISVYAPIKVVKKEKI